MAVYPTRCWPQQPPARARAAASVGRLNFQPYPVPSLNLVPRYAISKTKVWKAIPKESLTVGLTNNRVSQRDPLTNMTLTQTIRPLSLLKGVIVKS